MPNEIIPHLTFNGNCKEAMTFYQSCFGGDLVLQTLSETSPDLNIPHKMKQIIVSAKLTAPSVTIMGSDLVPEEGLIKGNNISLSIEVKSRKEMEVLTNQLCKNKKTISTISKTSSGSYITNLRDQYGIQWLLISSTTLIQVNN